MVGLVLAARAVAAPVPVAASPASARPPVSAAPPARAAKPRQAAGTPAQVTVDAASSEVNYKSGTVDFKDVVLSQGNTRVRADRANTTCLGQGPAAAAQCANSRWTFQGNVRIDASPRGSLSSDQAIVEVRDNRIASATVTGSPAVFEQQRADAMGMTRGHADQIVYNVEAGTVRLTNDAWVSLSGGSNDITSQQIVYDIRSEKVQATSPGTQGVHITLTPQSVPKKGRKPRPEPDQSTPASPAAGPPDVK
jgi:lipopolysaccharide transport protein LptA